MKKKTEYFFDMRPHVLRRIWEDENGNWFTVWSGKREEVDRERQHFFIKHEDDLKLNRREDDAE